jgi:hypothetical protein
MICTLGVLAWECRMGLCVVITHWRACIIIACMLDGKRSWERLLVW